MTFGMARSCSRRIETKPSRDHTVYQVATTFGENTRQIHNLKTGQRPVQFFVITLAIKNRDDTVLKTFLDERVGKFTVHPHGFHRFRRQDDHKPVAALQGRADCPLPLLGAPQMRPAIPDRNAVLAKKLCQLVGELAVPTGVGKKNLLRKNSSLVFHTQAGASSNPCLT